MTGAVVRRSSLLLPVLGFAALLRLLGIGWGLPDIFEEATLLVRAWTMWGWGTGQPIDLNPHFFT